MTASAAFFAGVGVGLVIGIALPLAGYVLALSKLTRGR